MPLLTNLLTATSLLFLAHAVYSAHEHASASSARRPIPADIVVEALVATLALTIAIVASAPPLRPIRWAEWAGRIEREGWLPGYEAETAAAGNQSRGGGGGSVREKGEGPGPGNPYRLLEERRGFWDVRAARKAFADFIREGESAG